MRAKFYYSRLAGKMEIGETGVGETEIGETVPPRRPRDNLEVQ